MSGTTSSPNQAYGYVVGAAIAKGRIALDRSRRGQGRARRARHRHRGECRQARQGQVQHRASCSAARRSSTIIRRSRVVVAETFEQARAAAAAGPRRLRRASRARSISRPRWTAPPRPATAATAARRRTAVGDFDGAFAAAPVKLDATYTTPDQSARDDGAACIDRRLGGRQADALDLQPDDRLGGARSRPRRSASPRRRSASSRPSSAAASAASCSCAPTRCSRRSARGRPGGR